MGLYDIFATDENLEKTGVWFDYGDFRILAGFSGGGNKKYTTYAEKKFKPLRRAIETGAMGNERSMAVLIDVFAETVIYGWQTKQTVDGEEQWADGIESRTGEILPFTKENVRSTLTALPNLFSDLQTQCSMISNYRNRDMEAEAKNL